ncbi:MAG TPA: 4Fe-4S dicluster domain-containing protein [Desulfuromonadales bacterium]
MQSWAFQAGFEDRLLQSLRPNYRILAPVRGADGVGRLQPVRRWTELSAGTLPLIPLKKVVFPPHDVLWTLLGIEYREPAPSTVPVALVGIAPCDLYAFAYLDLVFADDPHYQRRRQGLLLVGSSCRPNAECFCPPRREPPPFDLFLAADRLWVGSACGEDMLTALQEELSSPDDLPLPAEITDGQQQVPENLEQLFGASAGLPLWREVGERCVSCGACSAVCPTCYCYEMSDEALPDGRVNRRREWDNCFFRNHALVAGGQNFRPTRTERLRFRFEHKMLGFGALRGISSCVGCGRCARACPVDIDISAVLASLAGGGKP